MEIGEKSYSVTQINKYVKAVFDDDFVLKNVGITGEISNFKRHTTGHLYFTLKDEESAIACVMFCGDASGLLFEPKDGMSVTLRGSVSVFVKTGGYQIYVKKIEKSGEGNLYGRFQELKEKLLTEGLFDKRFKKPIAVDPKTVAVITSLAGAAVSDIISVIRRRNKSVKIAIFPVLVQGESAPGMIAEAIENVNKWGGADTIILGRGGGSIEDLWAFNEEEVARAIFASKIPIISAVGHETDFTISDFAADLRAATPSVSAEIAVPLLRERSEQIAEVCCSLNKAIKTIMSENESRILLVKNRLNKSIERIVEKKETGLLSAISVIEAVSPLNVLKRGYSLTYTKDEESPVDSIAKVVAKDIIVTALSDGKIVSEVVKTSAFKDEYNG